MEKLEKKLDEIMECLKGVQVQHKDDFKRLEHKTGYFREINGFHEFSIRRSKIDYQHIGKKKH